MNVRPRLQTLFKNIVSLQLVMLLSIGLLFFIGIGESYRVAPSLILTNLCNQGKLLKDSIDTSLKLGLPIEYPGFQSRAQNLAHQSELIAHAQVVANRAKGDQGVFGGQVLTCDMNGKALLETIKIDWMGVVLQEVPNQMFEIELMLEDKIGPVGSLNVITEKGVFSEDINRIFGDIFIVVSVLIGLVPLLIALLQRHFVKHQGMIQKGLYHLTFLAVALLIIDYQVGLYGNQIKAQSQSLAKNLTERLTIPTQLGFDLNSDFSGYEALLAAYRAESKDISHLYLLKDDSILVRSVAVEYESATPLLNEAGDSAHQDMSRLTGLQVSACRAPDVFDHRGEFIMNCLNIDDSAYRVLVQTPWTKVYGKIWDSSRNFLVLFIASILISNLFLNALLSIQRLSALPQKQIDSPYQCAVEPEQALELVKPIFALGILIEAINLAFLPAYLETLFVGSQWSVSSVFGVYFVCFAAILLPAGRWAESNKLKSMMWISLVISALALAGMAFTRDPMSIILLRGLAGVGQGILFISVQSYLIEIERQNPQVSGPRQLVIGFNISTVSGAAIGALLMPMLGESAVFILGSLIGLICALYTMYMIQDITPNWSPISRSPHKSETLKDKVIRGFKQHPHMLMRRLKQLLSDFEFNKTIVLIGLPTKAVYTGILIFVMPIFLKSMELDTELIGQILIFYYLGVLLTTVLGTQLASLIRHPRNLLILGVLGSGVGMILIGGAEWMLTYFDNVDLVLPHRQDPPNVPTLQLMSVILGTFLLGLSHGCIHAPVISHITHTALAKEVGASTTAAFYRFLERLGHVSGPALAAYLFIDTEGQTVTQQFIYVGSSIVVMGGVFAALSYSQKWWQKKEGLS